MDIQPTEYAGKPVPSSATEREDDLRFALEFTAKSNASCQDYLSEARELQDNYLVNTFSGWNFFPRIGAQGVAYKPSPHRRLRSMLKDPETHQIVESLSAQALGLLFGSRDYIRATPVGADDYEKAIVLSRIIQSVLEGPGVYRTMYQTWKDSFIVGVSVLELGWESRERQQIQEVPVVDDNGQVVSFAFVPVPTVYRQGPMIRQTDLWDFRPDPSGTRIQHDMIGCAKIFRMTKAEAMRLAESGKYDKKAVAAAVDQASSGDMRHSLGEERYELLQKSLPDKFGVLTGIEYWGECPYSHADKANNRVITVLEGELVRSTINPHRNGAKPFKEIVVNPMSGKFCGLSPSKVNKYLQDSADNMLMVMTDAADMMVRPVWLRGQAFQGDPNRVQRREFADVIDCGNPDALKAMPTDLNALQYAAMEYQRRKQGMKESAGSLDPVAQTLGGDRMAATTTSEIVRLASQRTEMMVMLSERDDYPFVGQMIHSMLRQFMPDEGVAVLNGQPMQFSLRDIDFDADIRFTGSRQAQSRFQKVASYREAIATIGPNIALIPIMPDLFVRLLRDGMEIADAEQIINKAVVAVQQQQALEMMTQGASAPSSTSGSMGTEAGAIQKEGVAIH